MNILVDDLPEAIDIDGQVYEINFDFQTCMQILIHFEDGQLADYEKQLLMINLLYKDVPADMGRAFAAGIAFLDGGDPPGKEGEKATSERLYSLKKDASLIYAAFQHSHRIDLQKVNLHWWKFLALFQDLGADTAFLNLVNLRQRVLSGKASKEERDVAKTLGDVFVIEQPEHLTYEEHNNRSAFWEAWEGGGKA